MLVYETVSFCYFCYNVFLIGTFHSLPKKNSVCLESVDNFPKRPQQKIPLFHHHLWALKTLIMSRLKTSFSPHQGCDRGGFVRAGIGQFAARRCSDSGVRLLQRSWGEWTSWAIKKRGPRECLGYFWGDDNLPRYIRIIINHHKDPYQTTSIMNVCCICATVDGSEILEKTTWDVRKPCR